MFQIRYGILLTTIMSFGVACDAAPDEGGQPASDPATGQEAPVESPGSNALPVDNGRSQSVYVPVYSHIYVGDRPDEFNLTVTLSIRNTDHSLSLLVDRVSYVDSNGEFVREYVQSPLSLRPMASTDFHIGEQDRTGGIGANFVVRWGGPENISDPVIEAVMVGTGAGQGISFTTAGRPMRPSDGTDPPSIETR